jgi:DNA-binding response OmpR family regulator
VVEDDTDARDVVGLICRVAGFEIHGAGSGQEGVRAVSLHRPDLVLLDVGLPDIDGFEVARQIRAFSDTRILMLTARADECDILTGFGAGADDYITKPFRSWELRHRIEAVMRRPMTEDRATASGRTGTGGPSWTVMEHNGLQLTEQARLTIVDGKPVNLTRIEFDLLHALMGSGRKVLAKADLAAVIHGSRQDPEIQPDGRPFAALEDHIGKLRRKLGDAAGAPRWVETVRGYGYRMAPEQGAHAAGEADG